MLLSFKRKITKVEENNILEYETIHAFNLQAKIVRVDLKRPILNLKRYDYFCFIVNVKIKW